MKNIICKILIIVMILLSIFINFSYAEVLIDKKGRIIDEITKPTAESTINPDTISDALRHVVNPAIDYSKKQYAGPTQNIISENILYSGTDVNSNNENYTKIRHTQSITDLSEDEFILTQDYAKDRLRLKIKIKNQGEFDAKNGFFKLNDKTFYFDEDGLMVLGPAYDDVGNYYFFSYETGELVEEIQKK